MGTHSKNEQNTDVRIRQALYDILCEKKIEDTCVSEIADRAGISRRSFYAYYKDKYDAVEAIFKELFAKYIGEPKPMTFQYFYIHMDPLMAENTAFLKNTIYFNGQNSLENAFSELIQNIFYQILDDNGWNRNADPNNLCSNACNIFSHSIIRLMYIDISNYKYDSAVYNEATKKNLISGAEVLKSLTPVILTKYFF